MSHRDAPDRSTCQGPRGLRPSLGVAPGVGVRDLARAPALARAVALVWLAGSALAVAQDSANPALAAGDQPVSFLASRNPGSPAQPWPAGVPRPTAVEHAAATAILRMATLDLRFVIDPGPADFRLTDYLLGQALELAPFDEPILRARLEAAWAAGDDLAAIEVTRRLIVLDPTDEISLLRLISARVNEQQTAEDRIATYDRLLGPGGADLPAPVRSRLALDAALLHRERGDDARFVQLLSQATSLDATHKEAAAMAVRYYTERAGDPMGRLDMLANLLYADPIDPNVWLAIASELSSGGAFSSARRFQDRGLALMRATFGDVGDALFVRDLALRWQTDGPAAAVAELNARLREIRDQADRDWYNARLTGRPTAGMIVPEDVTLTLPYERIRLLAALAAGDEPVTTAAAAALARVAAADLARLDLLDPQPPDAAELRQRIFTELQHARLLAGVDLDTARADLGEAASSPQVVEADRPLLAGWLLARNGKADEAIAALAPLAARSASARLGIVAAHESAGRTTEARVLLAEIALAEPESVEGAFARSRLLAAEPSAGTLTDRVAALDSFASGVPRWLDYTFADPTRFMDVTVTAPVTRPGPLDAAPLRVTIRNLAPIPLSLGPDRVINSRFLMVPRAVVIADLLPDAAPEVVDADRRLRLNPRESLTVEVWPHSWWVGSFLEAAGRDVTRVRWRVMQGFVISGEGRYVAGPMCLATETPTIDRPSNPDAQRPAAEIARLIREATGDRFADAVAAARAALMTDMVTGQTISEARIALLPPELQPVARAEMETRDAAIAAIVAAAAETYPARPKADRMLLLAALPHARLLRGMGPLDNAARAETDPDVLALVVVTRVRDADDPLLGTLRSFGDPRLTTVADHCADRIRNNRNGYALLRDLFAGEQAPLPEGARSAPGSAPGDPGRP